MVRRLFPRDIAGCRFSRLVALSISHKANSRIFWHCRCDCGGEKIVPASHLHTSRVKSCGCLFREMCGAKSMVRAGQIRPAGELPFCQQPLYGIWRGIIKRCRFENDKDYKHYGAVGINICDKWADDFFAFIADMGPRPSLAHSIDRINNSLGYEPGNCRWATAREQARNRACVTIVSLHGQNFTLMELADRYGIPYPTIRHRIKRQGLSVEEALRPVKRVLSHVD